MWQLTIIYTTPNCDNRLLGLVYLLNLGDILVARVYKLFKKCWVYVFKVFQALIGGWYPF